MSCCNNYLYYGIGFSLLYICYILYEHFKSRSSKCLENEHVLITGGSSGIGKEIAILSAERGANVTIIARDGAKLEKAIEEIRAKAKNSSQKITFYKGDVTIFEDVESIIQRCEAEIGPVDILINNAGYAYPSRLEDIPMSHVKGMMDINYMGAFHTIRSVLPSMKSRRKGRITVVSSIAGLMGLYGYSAYSASKFALRGLAEAVQMEVKPYGITVTVALPADTDTPAMEKENATKPLETKLIGDTAGLLNPADVAKTVLDGTLDGKFFASSCFDATLSIIICAGMSPITSISTLMIQVLTMGPLRFVGACYHFYFDRIIKGCADDKEKQKKSE